MQLLTRLKAEWSNFKTAPRWRVYLWGALVLFGVVYLAWCRWGEKPVKPGQVISARTAPAVANMERKAVTPKKLMVFTPKAQAVERLHLPADQAGNDDEEIFEATDAPPTRYGSTTVTFANTSTGMPRTVIVAKKAPLFSLERTNYLGGGVGYSSSDGTVGRIYYKRDLFQVKGVYVQPEVEAIARPQSKDRKGEAVIWVNAEYRW